MAEGVYKLIEIVGVSSKGFDEATRAAVDEASRTIRGMAWFEVIEMRGAIKENKVTEFQVKIKVAFRIERE